MQLETETTIDQFRAEMQHRVVRYPLRSRPVKEALRFAKRHQDPAFFRIASDKIHAQRQFQRELHGPTRIEKAVDFFTLGSLKEVVVTLLLVGGSVIALDAGKRAMGPGPDEEIYANMDVDALAERLGLALETSRTADSDTSTDPSDVPPLGIFESRTNFDASTDRLSDDDVNRIAEAVIERLSARQAGDKETAKHQDESQPEKVVASVETKRTDRERGGDAVDSKADVSEIPLPPVREIDPQSQSDDDPAALVAVTDESGR